MGDYKKLRVWQEACVFADCVAEFVETLPRHLRDRAREQLVPAAAGIHENISEGCGLNSDRQLLKFLRQALGTANESEDELLALDRAGYLPERSSSGRSRPRQRSPARASLQSPAGVTTSRGRIADGG